MATDELSAAVGWVAIVAARVELLAAQLEAAMIGTPDALPAFTSATPRAAWLLHPRNFVLR